MASKNVWAILNTCTKTVMAEVTHYQLAAEIENELSARWKAEMVGPMPKAFNLPFTLCRIDAISRFYPGYVA